MKLFSATWCTNCVPVKRFIEGQGLSVEVVDVDDNTTLTKDAGVRSIPTLQLGDDTLVVGPQAIIKHLKEIPTDE